jgi:hypothetical protein
VCNSRVLVWHHAKLLVLGAILARGKRTVTSALRALGLAVLRTIKLKGAEVTAVLSGVGFVPVSDINEKLAKKWPTDMQDLILSGKLAELYSWCCVDGNRQLAGLATHAIPMEVDHA